MTKVSGRLFLVSLGIGDPDNMTIRARKIIEEADVILAMKFIQEQYADLLEGKEVHNAGHALFTSMHDAKEGEEAEVRRIVLGAFEAGKTIAVLDFGDPTLYSPQSGYLREFAHLQPKVIPGISSFNAASAALGKELSGHYDRAIVLTETMDGQHFETLASTQSTMVIFTMRMDLHDVVRKLRKYYPEDTPVGVVVSAGFSDKEKVFHATLANIVGEMDKHKPSWAYLMYVGDFLR